MSPLTKLPTVVSQYQVVIGDLSNPDGWDVKVNSQT